MPIYTYRCTECGKDLEEFKHVRECEEPTTCECGGVANRTLGLAHTDMKNFHNPCELHSMGLAHPDEITAFRKRNPDIKISDDPNDPMYGVPIARNRKEKMSILKTEGYVEVERRSRR